MRQLNLSCSREYGFTLFHVSGLSSAMTPQTVPVPGAHDFVVVDLLGSGGFGQVWRIENSHTKEAYAMKVMGKKEVKEREQVSF